MGVYRKICVDCSTTFYCKGDGCGISEKISSNLPTEIKLEGCHCPKCTRRINRTMPKQEQLFLKACPKTFSVEEMIIEDL